MGCVPPYMGCVPPYMGCVPPYMGCVPPYMGCVPPYMGCVPPYMGCVPPYMGCIPEYIRCEFNWILFIYNSEGMKLVNNEIIQKAMQVYYTSIIYLLIVFEIFALKPLIYIGSNTLQRIVNRL